MMVLVFAVSVLVALLAQPRTMTFRTIQQLRMCGVDVWEYDSGLIARFLPQYGLYGISVAASCSAKDLPATLPTIITARFSLANECSRKLLPRLSDLQTLEFEDATGVKCSDLLSLQDLKEIHLHGEGYTGIDLVDLHRLPHLLKLNLSHSKVTDESIQSLKMLHSVRQIDLSGTQISDTGVEIVSQLPLHSLYLDYNKLTDLSVLHISKITGLEELRLCCDTISDEGLLLLAKGEVSDSLRALTILSLKIDSSGDCEIRKQLPKCTVRALVTHKSTDISQHIDPFDPNLSLKE